MNRLARNFLFLGIAGLSLAAEVAQAVGEEAFLRETLPASEQTIGIGRSALWTMPHVATQYQPLQHTPEIQKALQAQQEGRFLEALILLEEAAKNRQADADASAEINLLRVSFLLQGNQGKQAVKILTPLHADAKYAADAHALTAMALLQQGQMQQALDAARHAQELKGGILAHLALSYALQGAGRLVEARDAMHGFNAQASNTGAPQQAVALAREAELDLTLDQVPAAVALAKQAEKVQAADPYVVSVSGLAHLINGQAREAKADFEAALRRDPRDAKALFGLGLAEIRLGNLQAGQEKLQAANEAVAGDALILTYLGRAQQLTGQTGAAMDSFDSAQQADPKDPIPWLYQAQAQLQANRPQDARESLREAQERIANRSVYRSERLIREDEQLLRANLAEAQRQLGMESLAFHTLSDPVGEKNAATLRNQADLLQGQRFGESARRSLLLQSLFNERPGNLPAELDIYGDGAGQTGASAPQHGAISELNAQHASYNNYDELFGQRTLLSADAVSGGQNTNGEQVRFGYGSDTLGLGLAQRQFRTNGNARFESLDNRIGQAIVQWRPLDSTQAFVSHQRFHSLHDETLFPGDPGLMAQPIGITDNSQVTRLGLRHSLTDSSELRALWSHQQTDQLFDYLDPVTGISFWTQPANSYAHGAELQYRTSGTGYATQWGVQQTRARVIYTGWSDETRTARQFYAAWQQALGPHWQLDAQLGRGGIDRRSNLGGGIDTSMQRWLPKLGVAYTPDSGTHLRLAAWHGMGFGEAGDASLAPTSLAGILLNRPGDNNLNGMLVHGAAIGADKRLGPEWSLEGQAQRRRTDWLIAPVFTIGQSFRSFQLDESRLALHWQPKGHLWAVSLAHEQERFQAPPFPSYITSDSVQDQRLRAQQLELRWFAGKQWTMHLALSHNRVDGQLQTNWGTSLNPYGNSFEQVDTSLDWQIARPVSLSAGVRNAANKRTQYTEQDTLNPRFSKGRLGYVRLKLDW